MSDLYVLNFEPTYCPNCGHEFGKFDSDFYSPCSMSCPACGVHFQYANTPEILEAADKAGGEMRYYVERGL
jgi:predicted  nucleic acid-binding Zn-ribbon protein